MCNCSPLEECVGGTTCVPRYTQVQLLSPPASNAFFDYENGVVFNATLDLASGRTRNDPARLSWEATGDGGRLTGTLSRVDAGLYLGASSLPIGDWQARVFVPDAGLSAGPRAFKVLGLFRVTPGAPPSRPTSPQLITRDPADDAGVSFRRDDQTTVVVTNPGPASAVSLTVLGVRSDGGTDRLSLTQAPSCANCPDAGFCACFPLDLARPRLDAFRGTFEFEVVGTTVQVPVLQTTAVDPQRVRSVKVTRWKWSYAPGTTIDAGMTGQYIVQPPALDANGNLVAGFLNLDGMSASEFGIRSISPDGVARWTHPSSPTSQLVVAPGRDGGADRVIVAAQPEGFLSLSPSTGVGAAICPLPNMNTVLYGALALVDVPGQLPFFAPTLVPVVAGFEVPMGQRSLFTGVTVPPVITTCPSDPLSTGGPALFPLTASGDYVVLAEADANLYRTYTGNLSPGATFSPPMSHPVSTVNQILLRAGTLFGTSTTGFFGTPVPAIALPSGASAGSLVLSGADTALYPSTFAGAPVLVSVNLSSSAVARTALPFGGGVGLAVGKGGVVYALSATGALAVYQQGALSWVTPPSALPPGRFDVHPMPDCTRGPSGSPLPGRPGVLYLTAAPLGVTAIITDTAGVDTLSPWPLPFHDPRGTNNFTTPMNEFNCP